MDFGTVNFEGLVGSDKDTTTRDPKSSHGSGFFLKQERSDPPPADAADQELWRSSKTARTEPFESSTTMQATPLLRSNSAFSADGGQTMLSFSTGGNNKNSGFLDKSTQHSVYSFCQQPPAYTRNAGYGSGGLHAGMHVPVSRYKGPFTPSQWMELEHQALIYKHIVANVPVPSNLLTPLRKSFNPFLFSGSSSGSYAPNSFGWGTFHLGFSGSTDPEPGRCRRTDGKKWRCSRDAVPDQKYCERHINRGRHRSRKPVEGRNGHAVSVPASSKGGPIVSSSSAASVVPSSCASNSVGAMQQHQLMTLQSSGAANIAAESLINRTQEPRGISMISPHITLKSKETPFSIPKQHNPTEDSSRSDFGLVSSDSLLCPSQKSSYIYSTNYNPFSGCNDQDTQNQNPLRHFIDDWPKDQSDKTSVSWPEELKSDWTQLSMSIPMSSSDFSSSSNSPTQEKLTLSPLSLSHEFGPAHMGLGVGNDRTQKQEGNWKPVSWGNSMGGPLGEVLNSKNSVSAMNHMAEVWVGNSYLGSSPTGVLQKSTFVSLSNSSSGSSPRANKREAPYGGGSSLCDDVLGSTLASSSSIPSM